MEKKLIDTFVFSAALLTVSCGSGSGNDTSVTANRSGAVTRAHWQAERKPVVIETDTILSESIGVSMLLRDATADEFMALQSSCFERKGKVYRSNDYNALTSDTSAVAGICYPVHRGIKASGAIELKAPFTENLFGRETGREFGAETCIRMQWRSGMALLRIVTESDDVRDRLEGLTVSGDHIYSGGVYMPYTGDIALFLQNGYTRCGMEGYDPVWVSDTFVLDDFLVKWSKSYSCVLRQYHDMASQAKTKDQR